MPPVVRPAAERAQGQPRCVPSRGLMARHRLEPDEYGSVLVSDLRPLVHSSAGRPVPPTQLRTQRVWEPAVEHAGLKPLRIHDYADLRHTAVGFWIEAGLTESEIAARAGWGQFLPRYRHILRRTEERANDRLEALFLEAEQRRKSRGIDHSGFSSST